MKLKNIELIYLNKNQSGGNKVFDEIAKNSNVVQNYILRNDRMNFSIFNFVKILLKLLSIKKNSRRGNLLIASDPILCIFLGLFKIKYLRYIQADDILLFKDRLSKIYLFIYIFLYKKTLKENIICNSIFINNLIKQKYNISPLFIINPGTDLDEGKETYKKFDILYILRKAPWKNSSLFFKLLNSLSLEDYKILIINYDSLDFKINENRNISILGPQNKKQLSNLYKQSNFYLSTTINEGFGLPALEAMACGCIPIVPDRGGHTDFAINFTNSYFYEQNSIVNLLHTLSEIYNIDHETLAIIRDNCINTSKKFSWHIFREEFFKKINNLSL
jgi:glycosyltransferase involved in cell wall biosynthesis